MGPYGLEALQRELGRDLGVLRHQRLVVRGDRSQLELEALRVVKEQAVV